MTRPAIAVVGMACRYPDADSPDQLWRNVLAGRRAFRRLPDERMNLEDYYSPDPSAPDRFYSAKAAVIEGFVFDRVKYRVAGSTFRSTDMTHWLALDTAATALENAGFPAGAGLEGLETGVVIGNTLTGEFSRANTMRLRWPYVRRTTAAALRERGWDDAACSAFLADLESQYKSAFPPIDEDTLAGGLANTIAGRICNHFDFKGGGFTVDGACSSSLLSVATACTALADGQLDVALAGGVDLSIDPFEVIGFAKTGALATGEMKVYDRGSNGFWPGEGCGMVVLMRDQDAADRGLLRYARIAGWGYSSDGRGGITRPEADGHRRALRRAYARAGFGIEDTGFFEGHGTGTAVGDATELRAISAERRAAAPDAPPAAISTVKGNFGHTKAAAGIAGLLKAILAVRHQIIPPATGHYDPHPVLLEQNAALRVPDTAELWPADAPVRAGVSSMGFGGINAHIVVEHADGVRRTGLGSATRRLVRSRQDCELFLVDAAGIAELRGRVAGLAALAGRLSYAELGDLAATLQSELADRPVRAAIVATAPEQAEERFTRLLALLDGGARSVIDAPGGVFVGVRAAEPRIGLLFPGQGAGRRADGGALRRRFESIDALYRENPLPPHTDLVSTAVAQPRIVTASAAGLRLLTALGIDGVGAVGHSVGELTALHWAGALDESAVLRLAATRGRLMGERSAAGGAMAGLGAPPEAVLPLLADEDVVIAAYNGPAQTVVSGPADAVARVSTRAVAAGITAAAIAVSHAFHSPAIAPAVDPMRSALAEVGFGRPDGRVHSTVSGSVLPPETDLVDLLSVQLVEPVRFQEALKGLAAECDLLLEVGPGHILSTLAAEIAPGLPAIPLETDGPSLAGLLRAVGAAFALGATVFHDALFEGRYTRPLPLDNKFRFFASPCEAAPADGLADVATFADPPLEAGYGSPQPAAADASVGGTGILDVLVRLAAERAELPVEAVAAGSNPMDELHLSSITVGQIVNQAARELGIGVPTVTSAFATSTLAELAEMLEGLSATGTELDGERAAAEAGVAPWVRAFEVDLVEAHVGPRAAPHQEGGAWQLFASDAHPLAQPLHRELSAAGLGDGVVLCLPRACDETHVGLMLAAARVALSAHGPVRFVAVGDRRAAAGLAKTLHLESPQVTTTLVTVPLPEQLSPDQAAALAARIAADAAATEGFAEVSYDRAGERRVPSLRMLGEPPAPAGGKRTLDERDVLLVTGGGKGITAECALALGRDTGAAVGLIGRSDPEQDAELAANLDRMAAAGVRFHYTRADVTAADQVKTAVGEIREVLGAVTAVLHGAGRNEPRALADLDEDTFRRTLAPKIGGLEAVLAATDPARLKLLVSFASIIGRAGLRGEADYATANDWLTDLTRRVGEEYPDCRCISIEWSVWSGSGMGERLGVLESLVRQGIEPVPVEDGIAMLERLIDDPAAPTAVVVMGRSGGLPTLSWPQRELPLLRFLENPRVHYPGIELVADAELSADRDRYLADHLLDGDLLFPAVLGIEAMAQAAGALTGFAGPPVLEDVEFLRPIVVPAEGSSTLRVAALVTGPAEVRAVIRSGDTGFQADHFRATLRYGASREDIGVPVPEPAGALRLPLRPETDLYGSVLFQGSRFQRLLGYRDLGARHCVAEIATHGGQPWFASFLPAELVAGDPGSRDVYMHALQCCVPDATLLPAAVERLHLADPSDVAALEFVTLHALERSRDGDTYVYDLEVRSPGGTVLELWRGLRLQAVRKTDGSGPWLPSLLGPYLERRAEPTLGRDVRCAVWPDDPEGPGGVAQRRGATERALGWILPPGSSVRYRPDGRPESDSAAVSSSHGAGATFSVAADGPVGCDVELAVARDETDWADLLGTRGLALARLLAAEHAEDPDVSATRVWSAIECLRKTGHAMVDGLVADGAGDQGWVLLRSGDSRIASFATALAGRTGPAVFSILTEGGN